ncbi:hypothetical protein [Streptomyces mirabilis]|uniref:hypothetical protein n=1 Tax=Streptomyces mirabilis TaxID=68239 RepID=UPI003803706D
MKMPRLECEFCSRSIAAGIVAGRPSKGRLWRHDPKKRPEVFGDALVPCAGSLAIVDLLPTPGAQLEFEEPDEAADEQSTGPLGTVALF